MFQKHVPIGHIWFVSGFKGQELKKEEYLGSRAEEAVHNALTKKRSENKEVPVFLYYEDNRTSYAPFKVSELLHLKVLYNKYGSFNYRKVPKKIITGEERSNYTPKQYDVKSGFKDDKLPTKKELRDQNLSNITKP